MTLQPWKVLLHGGTLTTTELQAKVLLARLEGSRGSPGKSGLIVRKLSRYGHALLKKLGLRAAQALRGDAPEIEELLAGKAVGISNRMPASGAPNQRTSRRRSVAAASPDTAIAKS